MTQEFRTRTFKAGNSVALRLPKSMGLTEGEDVRIVSHADGRFTFYRSDDAQDAFFNLPGRLSAGFMEGGRGDTVQPDRDWTDGGSVAAA